MLFVIKVAGFLVNKLNKLKMVETFISHTGSGKSGCMLIESAKQTGKNVAFISLEISVKEIMSRLVHINPTANSFRVFAPRVDEKTLSSWLVKKIAQLAEDFDIICVDAVDSVFFDAGDIKSSGQSKFIEKINNACFNGFMTQCESLWVSKNVYRKMEFDEDYIVDAKAIESFEIPGLIKVKQVCRRVEHPLLPGVFSIEAVDLVTKEVKTYNFSKLFKN